MGNEIEKISENVFLVTIGRPPRQLPDIPHYRGDMFSLTIIGQNHDESPFDFQGTDRAVMQFRVRPESKKIEAEFSKDDGSVILGKTDPGQEEFDEFHIYDPTGEKLKTKLRELHADLELVLQGDKFTPVYFRLPVTYDVTRVA